MICHFHDMSLNVRSIDNLVPYLTRNQTVQFVCKGHIQSYENKFTCLYFENIYRISLRPLIVYSKLQKMSYRSNIRFHIASKKHRICSVIYYSISFNTSFSAVESIHTSRIRNYTFSCQENKVVLPRQIVNYKTTLPYSFISIGASEQTSVIYCYNPTLFFCQLLVYFLLHNLNG